MLLSDVAYHITRSKLPDHYVETRLDSALTNVNGSEVSTSSYHLGGSSLIIPVTHRQ